MEGFDGMHVKSMQSKRTHCIMVGGWESRGICDFLAQGVQNWAIAIAAVDIGHISVTFEQEPSLVNLPSFYHVRKSHPHPSFYLLSTRSNSGDKMRLYASYA
jgi:hypothetical protein